MDLFWRLEDIPELGHLEPGDRRALIRGHVSRSARAMLWLKPAIFGLGMAGTVGLVLDHYRIDFAVTGVMTIITLAASSAISLQLALQSIRVQLRWTMRQELKGDR